jgi:hypothetical protein
MTKKLKNIASAIRVNYKGKKLDKKYVIFESDDWGAIRTPSKNVLDDYSANKIDLSNSVYKFDSLENSDDFDRIFEVLNSVKDVNGFPAKITANTIVANPDFDKIHKNNFKEYFYEPFIETYRSYHSSSSTFESFKKGINEGFFFPQFHGREHLNIARWLKDLNNQKKQTLLSFHLKSTYSGVGDYSYMEAFDWDSKKEIENHKIIISDGLKLFEKIFGFSSKSFIPPCYNLDPQLNTFLYDHGIEILQGMRVQLAPTGEFNRYKKIPHYFFERDASGLLFNIRNVFFEPVFNKHFDWVDKSMKDIEIAFLFGKPAVISTHRINYISSISEKNGGLGLRLLSEFLKKLVVKWPDIEFISTPELLNLN